MSETDTDTDTEPAEWPLPFSRPMVLALLDGRKTMTRRVVVPANSTVLGYPAGRYWPGLQFGHAVPRPKASIFMVLMGKDAAPPDPHLDVPYQHPEDPPGTPDDLPWYRVRPRWRVRGRLWVKETSYIAPPNFAGPAEGNCVDHEGRRRIVGYAATMNGEAVRCAEDYKVKKTPSIFLPRWASRVLLEITAIRAERLNSITEEDARAEGCGSAAEFRSLWHEINGKKHPWASNPWLWCLSFRRLNP